MAARENVVTVPRYEKLAEMHETMLKIRMFEERVLELGLRGEIRGSFHLSRGQEASAVGACAPLGDKDCITSTHRGHGHCIAKGGKLTLMMAELMGKATGYCKGKGGSMHIADPGLGILGANGIVGGGIPIATGAALAAKYRKSGQVVVCFFGDGAANQGCLYESMNMASVWKLPVVYLCEHNMYGMTTPAVEVQAGNSIADRGKGFDVPGWVVDGNDVLAVYDRVRESVEKARAGDGPALIECRTYRWDGHWQGDPCVYRTKEEVEHWKKKDPIARYEKWLLSQSILSERELEDARDRVRVLIDEAVEFGINSPEPDPGALLADIVC